MKNYTKKLWLVGTGGMAKEYAKVLHALKIPFCAIGRSKESSIKFSKEFNIPTFSGGLIEFLQNKPELPEKVIVAVGIDALTSVTLQLLDYGITDILLEKPGVGYPKEINLVVSLTNEKKANVILAYNRRFYSAVFSAEDIIRNDGGVTSFAFEFTEWSHAIRTLSKTKVEHNTWFLGNSTHVIDTAFYLGGKPKSLSAYYKGSLDWHPASSIFSGAGISQKGALFSYHANWESPGRWVIEIMTRKHRLIFKPMESLQLQKIGSVALELVEIDDSLDVNFKPGLYLQTESFLKSDFSRFCTIQEQMETIELYYNKMSGYNFE